MLHLSFSQTVTALLKTECPVELLYSALVSAAVLPEHSDELWSEQLWPQCFDLSNITQKPQHVAVKLLLIWKLLEEDHAIGELLHYTVRNQENTAIKA